MLHRPALAAVPLRAVAPPAAAVVLGAVAVALELSTPDGVSAALELGTGPIDLLTALVLAAAGAVVLTAQPRSVPGWVLAAGGLVWALDVVATAWLGWAVSSSPARPGASLAYWATNRVGVATLLPLPLLLALYPTGRLPRGRWRGPVAAGLAVCCLLPVVLAVVPSQVAIDRAGGDLPLTSGLDLDPTTLPLPAAVARPLLDAVLPLAALGVLVATLSLVARHRAATGLERDRLRWLLWAGVVDVLVLALGLVVPGVSGSVGLLVAVTVTSAATVVGLLRPRLVDVDALLGGTVVYGALGAGVVLLDALVVAGSDAVLGSRASERSAFVVVLLLATVGYLPARSLLWRLARRLLVGHRDDPYRVVSQLADRLETAETAEEQLPAVAAAVATAFGVRYVGVEVQRTGGDRVLGEHGTRPADVDALDVAYRGEVVGRLLLPRRGLRARLSRRDERLLGDLVRQAVVATRTAELAAQLQAGREALVLAREEERRRIRRDLHDGLGPALGAVALRIDTARNVAAGDPVRADELLRQARADAAAVLADVRRLVHDLRPPALDDVGLVGAVRQQAERLAGPELRIEVAGDGVGDLPAAVEVAAYRIAAEALHNVRRHAAASRCAVLLAREPGGLRVEVSDDGAGIDPGRVSGVGLVSVRERAAELGGRCEVLCPEAGGTLVRAWLPAPVPAPAAEGAR
ncbi:histidine kinase [Modestobacter sp. NPDC049651]|uniref:sensor histidine kinase n=1 Tax=unclassified Modestobacter TaxID=2643866 RepID=UPI0033FFE356